MRFVSLTFYGLIIVVFAGCAGSKKSKAPASLPGAWQAQPIVIDGENNDWPSPYPNYDAKAMVAYATSNDRKNLYITVESGDEMTELKMVKRGFTVLIDTSGGKDGQFTINYPLENDNDPLEYPRKEDFQENGNANKFVKRQMTGKIRRGADEATQLSLEGFGSCSGGYMAKKATPCGIRMIIKVDSFNELVWEAVVPFKVIYGVDSLTPAYAGKPISVCFAVKAFKYPDSKTSGGDNAGSSNMGNGTVSGMSRNGMGMNGGRGTKSADNPLQHLYDNTKTWKQFGVAYQ